MASIEAARRDEGLPFAAGEVNPVSHRMIELEDFNEAIELLREIIESQMDLRQKTQDQHKEGLRDLLED